MDLEYDRKFEEMKKYIPFLENMIKRLENTSSASNPRQAQLDKIRSLRDLLMDKKKRMKMENLLKCEQVLVNLYEKVEQRDSLPGPKKNANTSQDNADLNIVRSKLKSAVLKIQNENVETLPEIARASETEEVCVPGSKEPALFQRRPNKPSISPTNTCSSQNKNTETSPQMPKRSYTRVLLSPEPGQNRWSTEESNSEKPIFSRRSPRKSPRRRSPSYHRKERRKPMKSKPNLSNDLNITLKVPEESLSSLNTKDILSRIIHCSDNDVDIDTLRELRTQILGELKETGANEDISDLILKSYKKKGKIGTKTDEVEEGELSDSESEAIESIYGSLIIVDKDKARTSMTNKKPNEENSRKIQICLVINSDKNKADIKEDNQTNSTVDTSEFETFSSEKQNDINNDTKSNDLEKNAVVAEKPLDQPTAEHTTSSDNNNQIEIVAISEKENSHLFEDQVETNSLILINTEKTEIQKQSESLESKEITNFYKPIIEENHNKHSAEDELGSKLQTAKVQNEQNKTVTSDVNIITENSNVVIPLLEPAKNVSEIDILQALKKEILSETDNVLSTDAITPPLHQPKITKVINAHEIGNKKRISIEKYKAKSSAPLKSLSMNETSKNSTKDDINRKQSLKLTEKECERFNFPSKLTLDESSEDEDKTNLSMDDIYENLAPKSPDHDDFADMGIKPPVIIPSDPVQTPIVCSDADIDMRKILPFVQSNPNDDVANLMTVCKENTQKPFLIEKESTKRNIDPRMKRETNALVKSESPNPYSNNFGKTSRPIQPNYANLSPNTNVLQNVNSNSSLSLNVNVAPNGNIMMSPSLPTNMSSHIIPNMTPNMVSNLVPNMTPTRTVNIMPTARTYDMTPSRQADNEDFSNRNHVYAPTYPVNDTWDHNEKQRDNQKQPWDICDNSRVPFWEDVDGRDQRNIPTQRDSEYKRTFEKYKNGPRNDLYNFDIDLSQRVDCPPTPIHPFGMLECPATPNHPFGRLECPATPNPSFGRMDMPLTPVHPFGRSECPSTPNPSFGRPEPILPFVRPDLNQPNPNLSYGKPLDPRLNRNSDYENYHNQDDDRERCYFQEPNFNSYSYKSDHKNRNNNSEFGRRYQQDKNIGRNERNKNYEQYGRRSRRESSVGRYSRDYDADKSFNKNRSSSQRNYDYRHQNESKNYEEGSRGSYQRDKSIGRKSSRSTRDHSVGRTFSKENQLSVQRSTGSFTIDTSVNSSFQGMKYKDSSFDARRQRASSVGRTLVSSGRALSPNRAVKNEVQYNSSEDKNKKLHFRRACSVGREIKHSELNFKDIKADLKSFRLRGESRWSKEISKDEESIHRTSEPLKKCDSRSRKEINNKFNPGYIKYSPKKNNRDPRMRRENSYENKNSYRSKSKDSNKTYGIVYSNDNITKGTILGPGYGVKNYKIPKIKRPEETVDKNESKEGKLKDNTNEEASNKVPVSKKCSDKVAEEKESNFTKNTTLDSKQTSKDKKLDGANSVKKLRGAKYEVDSFDKSKVTTENPAVKIAQDMNIIGSDSQDSIKNSDKKQKSGVENCTNSVNVSIDSVEKRVTRSTSKSFSMDSLAEISPIKRTKRGKKPLIYESDSDDNDKKIKTKLPSNATQSSEKINTESLNNNSLVSSAVAYKIEASITQETSKSKNSNDKHCELESSFGIDDLEIFPDNITSDPVIDNINALIADLDSDLDSSKNIDSNSNFTRELTLETMLENITSPDDNDKQTDSPDMLPENVDTVSNNADQLECDNDTKLSPCEETISESSTNNTITLGINKNEDKQDIKTQDCVSPNKSEFKILKSLSSEHASVTEDLDKNLKNLDAENKCNSDAIVSTSDSREKEKIDVHRQQELNHKANIQTVPDSTINSTGAFDSSESQRSLPDSTNDLNSEMNFVISSTHNTSDTDKIIAETTSSDISASTQIESFGKLLTILQDKSKIKELLGLLGDQSSENEKIKKKLEKLSEIVSDDENSDENKDSEKVQSNLFEPKSQIDKKLDILLEKNKGEDGERNNSPLLKQNDEKLTNENEKNESNSFIEDVHRESSVEINEKCINDAIDSAKTIINEKNNINDNDENSSAQFEAQTEETNKICEQKVHSPVKMKQTTKKNSKNMPKKCKKRTVIKKVPNENKRQTRSDAANIHFEKPIMKKPCRELLKLQEDIREMFIRDDVLSATGIRMCRLAKLVDETKNSTAESTNENSNQEPVVVLEKCNDLKTSEEKITRKRTTKIKKKPLQLDSSLDSDKLEKNGNSSLKLGHNLTENIKAKHKEIGDIDPYIFETDSVNETVNSIDSKNVDKSSESESDSVDSSRSFGSTELLAEIKKKVKRKRVGKGWQAGIIKPKNKKKRKDFKAESSLIHDNNIVDSEKKVEIPDPNCFTDKNYCFSKNLPTYDCRLCLYNGSDIVYHYRKQHPHSEIPLSRMSPNIAIQAIKESEKVNFQVMSKVTSKRYICRFCFKEFGRKKPVLESFFWHIVSMHTGEYKQLCSECLNITRCPFNLDIPPPPKENKGQLLGYVCEKCNYTQISLENLKSHVILRHNDEQTAVYTINLSITSKRILNNILIETEDKQKTNIENQLPRVLRSSRSNQSFEESSDVRSESTEESNRNSIKQNLKPIEKETVSDIDNVIKTSNIQSKITFENDNTDEISNFDDYERSAIKMEPELNESQNEPEHPEEFDTPESGEKSEVPIISNDIVNCPHFKIKYSESGSKEYICCINGKDFHYRTTLLISFKKHVQLKHSEHWDGYCFICKVIVMPQGAYLFKDCLQHFLDQHLDHFPVLEDISEQLPQIEPDISAKSNCNNVTTKSYINVRPLSELISTSNDSQILSENISTLPVIKSVVSLGAGIEQPLPSPSHLRPEIEEILKEYKYEEAQAEIMSKKHRVVLEAMMSEVKLTQVFKCAGRFCSFTTDSVEDALLHASTHKRVGGENSLKCVYCDFDSSSNAIDLITHVFKKHGCCQYVCSLCFYRAAASQLVNAHIKRVHEESNTATILHTAVQTAPIKEDNILSREAAVPYYLCCASSGSEAPCKFRTYTPGKFCEHLQIKHSSATEHACFMCSASFPTTSDLIRHLKTHGLKLYQCTWCVHGADNETELLDHASAKHPDKQPKAYLRIITNKEGTTEYRVLPLAQLNKSDIPVNDISPSNIKENPVKEAERSMDLEKLIGHTTLMIESMGVVVQSNKVEKDSTSEQINKTWVENTPILETLLEQSSPTTPPPQLDDRIQQENQLTPIIKVETFEKTPEKSSLNDSNVIFCLDSDDEDISQNTIDLSDVGPSSNAQVTENNTPKIVPPTQLFLCAKCNITLKCGAGFKKHITACYSLISDPIPCAHCTIKVNKKDIVTHYTKTHTKVLKAQACSKCSKKFATLAQVREHERNDHAKSSNNVLNAEKTTITTQAKPAPKGRQKRSLVTRDKAIEPPEKMKRFGPQDINLLPINPILDDSVYCSLCEFNTKVRLNMVRHLQFHADQQPVPQTAPVNPVPHLETNEKHFDKMLNLASSSIVSRSADKNKNDNNTAMLMIPPETASRYPKYVPEKHRHTCGAKGCSYISVDESMLKCHWETLHSGTNDYRCVHCPQHHHLDTTKPLTAVRIIAHLKMHDTTLYACSMCSYYHYKRNILENHLLDFHKGGQILVVREEGITTPANTSQVQIAAPTMDLKPWQCGLCKFKSLLRQEVVDHCAKIHNSKMQYKCAYCAFRTSNSENITKHQSKSHSDKQEEIFYYYYRESTVPDDPDGTPRWQIQSQKNCSSEPTIKSEASVDTSPTPQISLPVTKPPSTEVNLDLVKKEIIEPVQETIEDLCNDFGDFCEPNGLKYKCSLCKNVFEDNIDAMQSHLYEELKYRKWGCSICSYKAFHKAGLSDHMQTEHRQNREPIALQADNRIETWVAKLLEHQTLLIQKNKENLAKQKEEILRAIPGPSRSKSPPKETENSQTNKGVAKKSSDKPSMVELEKFFGSLGVSVNMSFCCPKCHSVIKDEGVMRNHLESELNKIRWFCSNCTITFQTYHEAQFHCRSIHIRQSARPVEATKDHSLRSAWVDAVIRVQKLSMNYVPLPSKSSDIDAQPEPETNVPDNSLLVVRYEERVPTPEERLARKTPVLQHDSDEDKLIIDEPLEARKVKAAKTCQYCDYKSLNVTVLRHHVLRHYSLKPFTCEYCGINGSKKIIEQHHKKEHSNLPLQFISTTIPTESPSTFLQKQTKNLQDSANTTLDIAQKQSKTLNSAKVICLVCRNEFTEDETANHVHDTVPTSFGKKGDVVVRCNNCFTFHKDISAYYNHHKRIHTSLSIDYVYSILFTITNESKMMLYACSNCDQKFSHLKDLKLHADAYHGSQLKYTIVQKIPDTPTDVICLEDNDERGTKRTNSDDTELPISKKVAKKSTTKLPHNKSFAKKSTTKLPFNVPSEFSYYGKRPSTDDLDNVTTVMSFCNTFVPFTYKKLKEIININPVVLVNKFNES